MAFAGLVVFISLVVVGSSISGLPGDEISVTAAAGYALWLGLLGLVAGSVAFAIAPFLGRGAAAGFATAVLFGGFLLNGYQSAIPQLAPLANLTWFGWTTNHVPLGGLYDWASLVLVAVVALVLFVIGTEAFVRRDLAATSAVPTPSLPRALVGLRGPASRATGEILPSALAWGIGIGIFGLLIAGSGRSFVEQLASSPDFSKLLASIFPGHDVGTVGGFLQLLFLQFGLIFAGLAAATACREMGLGRDERSSRTPPRGPLPANALGRGRVASGSSPVSWSSSSSPRSGSPSGRPSPVATSRHRSPGPSRSVSSRWRWPGSASRSAASSGPASPVRQSPS